ncbi:portal protein [Mycobacterium phage Thonko]|uniref:Portal protein n=1 Tax=Mycobacterium phage Thonko TaxID=2282910 RepID=A0A346FC54_9CAUD|nr:portal protein [Mycobacterium phage Thonko]AXN53279.1 portal protein [Mycobacterium phage Thonko]
MAGTLRIVRRPKGNSAPSRPLALTAASQPLDDLGGKSFKTSVTGRSRENWQSDAWDMLDHVGELRYYVGWRAGSCSRARLVASEIDPETGRPTGGIAEDNPEGQRVAEIVKAIAGGPGGQAQLVKRSVECLTVVGEVWIAIVAHSDGVERWYALSNDEIKTTSRGATRKTVIELPNGEQYELNRATDSIFRIWQPRPRRAKEADSPVRSVLDPLREVVRTTSTIAKAAKSRLIGNGVLLVPHEMSLPSAQSPVSANKPGVVLPPSVGQPAVQQLTELLFQVAVAAIEDPDSMAAHVPIIAGVPGEQIKDIKHLRFDDEITKVAIETRNDAIARIALGLDVSPERLLGVGKQANHWSAWQIGDEDVQLHITPVLETFCAGIDDEILKATLIREGIDPSKYCLWYDTSQLTADPDKTDEATAAFDRGVINAEAYRRYLGLGDEDGYDFTQIEDVARWALDIVGRKPELVATYAPVIEQIVGALGEIKAPTPAIEQPSDEEDEDEDRSGADRQQEPDTEDDAEASASTRTASRAELIIAERMLVNRALELAGKRRRTRADAARLRDVPVAETHRFMPPVAEAEIPRLIAGYDAALEDEAIALLGIDTDALRSRARQIIKRELTTQVVEAEVV